MVLVSKAESQPLVAVLKAITKKQTKNTIREAFVMNGDLFCYDSPTKT